MLKSLELHKLSLLCAPSDFPGPPVHLLDLVIHSKCSLFLHEGAEMGPSCLQDVSLVWLSFAKDSESPCPQCHKCLDC